MNRSRAVVFVLAAWLAAALPCAAADGITALFTPGSSHSGGANSAFKTALIDFIKSATKTVEIAVFNFQDRELIETLNTIAAAGQVSIKVVVDDVNYPVRTSDGTLSLSGSIPTKYDDDPNNEMHHKFVIIDRGESGAAVWTGSANFNRPNLTTMNNNALIIRSSDIASTFGTEFDLMWSGKFHANKATPSVRTSYTVAGIPVEVRFSPRDLPLDRMVSAVSSLTTSLYYAIYTYGSPELGNAMIAKKSTVGSANLGNFDQGQHGFTASYSSLLGAGMNVMTDLNADVLHHKYAVLDGYSVFTGSMNFTVAGNTVNDENSVLVQDAALARAYLAELARISSVSIGTITGSDWKDSVTVGSASSTPVSTSIIEPARDKAVAIAYPNPCILSSGQMLTLATQPEATLTSVRVYAQDGRLIHTMMPTTSSTRITWDGRNTRGDVMASGTYILEMETRSSGVARGVVTLIR